MGPPPLSDLRGQRIRRHLETRVTKLVSPCHKSSGALWPSGSKGRQRKEPVCSSQTCSPVCRPWRAGPHPTPPSTVASGMRGAVAVVAASVPSAPVRAFCAVRLWQLQSARA